METLKVYWKDRSPVCLHYGVLTDTELDVRVMKQSEREYKSFDKRCDQVTIHIIVGRKEPNV